MVNINSEILRCGANSTFFMIGNNNNEYSTRTIWTVLEVMISLVARNIKANIMDEITIS